MRPDCILIEPSSTLRTVCIRIFDEHGLDARCVEDVPSALQAIGERVPAVVVCAGIVPGFPSASLLAAVRESPHHRAIPIVLLTGDVEGRLREGRLQPDAIVAKDTHLEDNLRAFLDGVGLHWRKDSAEDFDSNAMDLRGTRLLLAEDSPVSRRATSRILHVSGAEVVVVENGREAVDALGRGEFDLVLMDVEMPVMDGREATRALRERGESVPILALTGHDPRELADEAYLIGFDDVLSKSINRFDLVRSCLSHLAA